MPVPLTEGAIKEIMMNPNNLPKNPILQILGLKKVGQGQSNPNDRYRMVLSDGIHAHTCAMLATQLNHMVNENEIEAKAVIRLDKYICNVIQSTRKVLILLGVSVIQKASASERYGEPTPYDESKINTANKPTVQKSPVKKDHYTSTSLGSSHYANNQRSAGGPPNQNNNIGNVYPISSLNPYNSRWTICARVTSKSTIREWSNSRGNGRLFNVELIDESGEIRATCFTDLVDKFYPKLEQNKVYYISKGSVKPANKKYSSIKNDYELTFNHDTSIELCTESKDLPVLQFNFLNIANIEKIEPDQLVDVIGVCSDITDVVEITTRAGKQVAKRNLQIMDKTASITCTLWGHEAQSLEQYVGSNPIIAIKGAKVSDFSGKSISVLSSSAIHIDPDNVQESFELRQWYDTESHENINSITGQRGEGKITNVYKHVGEIAESLQGMSDKPEYFSVIGAVTYIKKENCLYKACPRKDCNKKIIEDGERYICEKCNETYSSYKYRLLLKFLFVDGSGKYWATCFQNSAESLLGMTAEQVGELMETNEKRFDRLFERGFRRGHFCVRAKIDKFNEEARLQCTFDKVLPINYKKETRRLMQELDQMIDS
ncbi:replication protein A 70 kDa DNA-binding subunit-like [Xenia sp. Carnegie-2017]|uniref:replication protein A 70 kDa DNA-binding subunit-like n=1 Tax=Xenia sp. Carnegie-2017 TaxID=2897299 RepID=UPI001F042AE9|nr:replication protein A 70 kDa DNA-binding subunit-like [Xenia sp. Carnegie-2017]